MDTKEIKLKKELLRNISIIIVGLLFIPFVIIFLLVQQHIQYNAVVKEKFGEEIQNVSINISQDIFNYLDQSMQLLSLKDISKENMQAFLQLLSIESIYDELTEEFKELDNLHPRTDNIFFTLTEDGGKIIVQKNSSAIVLGNNFFRKITHNFSKHHIFILSNNMDLIFNNNNSISAAEILKSDKFKSYFKTDISNKTGYSYYDNYGKYGRQTIISFAPVKDPQTSANIGSIVIIKETMKLIPDEKISNAVLFTVFFFGGTILIKLIFKFSEIIIAYFFKINKELSETSKENASFKKKLFISEKLAALGRITSGIAHEIGNPLSSILSISQILTTQKLDKDKTHRFICDIRKEALRIDNIIKEFMLFQKNNQKDHYTFLNINTTLEAAIENISKSKKNDKAIIYKDFSSNLPNFFGNQNKLIIAFSNIISNAYQAIEGKGTIYIRTIKQNSMIRISIKDTGKGIKKEEINKIFDPFFTTKDVGKGMGLGLFICQQIITAHNGKIKLSSEIDKGTEFIIHLPFQSLEEQNS